MHLTKEEIQIATGHKKKRCLASDDFRKLKMKTVIRHVP